MTFAAGMIRIVFPWLTVQRHLKGKHNQKDHGKRGGAGNGARQLTLFDKDQYISQEWKDAREAEEQAALEAEAAALEAEAMKEKQDWIDEKRMEWSDLYLYELDDMGDEEFGQWVEEIESSWDENTNGSMNLAEFINFTYNWGDPETGLTTQVTEVEGGRFGLTIKGNVNVGDYGYGQEVGYFERYIFDGTVEHSHFEIDPGSQGEGFGRRFYKSCEEMYQEAGLHEVTIHANIDVGGYAWAKMGYDFQKQEDRTKMVNVLALEYDLEYGAGEWTKKVDSGEITEPYHSWEVAAFAGPDGKRLGKDVMLGSNWYAYKSLDPNDPTWIAGQEYYASKGL